MFRKWLKNIPPNIYNSVSNILTIVSFSVSVLLITIVKTTPIFKFKLIQDNDIRFKNVCSPPLTVKNILL